MKHIIRNVVARLGEVTRTDMRYIARGSFWTSLGFGTGSILSLILTVAFANLLSKEAYGTYKYILSFSGLLSFLTLTGMNVAVGQMVARGHDKILSFSVKVQLKFNTLFLLSCLGLGIYYFLKDNTVIAYSLILLGVCVSVSNALNTYGAYLIGKQQFRKNSILGTITNLSFTGVMLLALLLTQDVTWLVAAYCAGTLLPTALIYYRIQRAAPSDPTAQEKQELVHYSRHISIMGVLSNIAAYADNILVFHHFGAIELALYGLADAMPSRLKGYIKSLIGITFPKLAKKDPRAIRKSLWLRLAQAITLGASLAGLYWMAAPMLFTLLFPAYPDAIYFSQLIMLNVVFLPAVAYTANVLQAQHSVRALYISSISTNLVRLLLYILLVKSLGIYGIILGLITSTAYTVLINIILIKRGYGTLAGTTTIMPSANTEGIRA